MDAIIKILPHALDLLSDQHSETVKETHAQIQGHQCTHHESEENLTGQSAPLDAPGKGDGGKDLVFFNNKFRSQCQEKPVVLLIP